MQLEVIEIRRDAVHEEALLLDEVMKKRNSGNADVRDLEGFEYGDIDLLLGRFEFTFECPSVRLKNPDYIIEKMRKILTEDFDVDINKVRDFSCLLNYMSGARGKRLCEKAIESLKDEELDTLSCWLYTHSCHNFDADRSLVVAFKNEEYSALSSKVVDTMISYNMISTKQSCDGYFFKIIEMTIIPTWWWIQEYKNKRNGVDTNCLLNASLHFNQMQNQLKDIKRQKTYANEAKFIGEIFINQVCIQHEMMSFIKNTTKNKVILKDLLENAVQTDSVENSGDVNACEVDVFIGDYNLKAPKRVHVSVMNTDYVLKKIKDLLIKKNLFDKEELLTHANIIEAMCGSEGFRRTRFALQELSDSELDIAIDWVYAYARVFSCQRRALNIAFHAVSVEKNKEDIDVIDLFGIYYVRGIRGIKTQGFTVVEPFYWIQKLKESRRR